jgi:hypothetical protein
MLSPRHVEVQIDLCSSQSSQKSDTHYINSAVWSMFQPARELTHHLLHHPGLVMPPCICLSCSLYTGHLPLLCLSVKTKDHHTAYTSCIAKYKVDAINHHRVTSR